MGVVVDEGVLALPVAEHTGQQRASGYAPVPVGSAKEKDDDVLIRRGGVDVLQCPIKVHCAVPVAEELLDDLLVAPQASTISAFARVADVPEVVDEEAPCLELRVEPGPPGRRLLELVLPPVLVGADVVLDPRGQNRDPRMGSPNVDVVVRGVPLNAVADSLGGPLRCPFHHGSLVQRIQKKQVGINLDCRVALRIYSRIALRGFVRCRPIFLSRSFDPTNIHTLRKRFRPNMKA